MSGVTGLDGRGLWHDAAMSGAERESTIQPKRLAPPDAPALGLLAALGLGLVPYLASWARSASGRFADFGPSLALVLALGLLAAAALLARSPRAGRALGVLALAGTAACGAAFLGDRPARVLLLGLVVVSGLALLFPRPASRARRRPAARAAAVRSFAAVLAAGGLAALLTGHRALLPEVMVLGSLLGAWAALRPAARPAAPTDKPVPWRLRPGLSLSLLGTLALLMAALGWRSDGAALIALGLPLVAAASLRAGGRRASGPEASWWRGLAGHPASLLSASFLATALVGTLALGLPGARAPGVQAGLLDAAFTSFSATCVTGLVVLDTGEELSAFGQGVVLVLIQVGGLGIMTFSAAFLVLLGRSLSLREGSSVAEVLGAESRGRLVAALRRVLLVTLVAESLGAASLTLLFHAGGEALGPAAWRGSFTAVSAWCNAGFALQADSLVPYQGQPAVLLVVSALVVLGGLGPAVVVALPAWMARRRTELHVELTLWTSALLLLGAFSLLLAFEWGAGLGHLALGDRLANAWFQAVTPRTAGFNSLDLATLGAPSIVLLEGLMFIGGAPASTAGGIKVTTAAVLALATLGVLRGRRRAVAAGRRLGAETVERAVAVTLLGALSAAGVLLALLLTQDIPAGAAVFEAISALCTVGLSLGATAELDAVGKILVIAAMYLGRVGPLSVLMLFAAGRRPRPGWRPESPVPVG